ncbi:alpha/beta fold hydrolase [Methylobacterium oxalidis]|uniref:Oxidoreductase n=1 Tax=Methylobacterium oxalidis TaxID=944322 RepID=A0A512JCZ1_9HYPH|nr:alpha/beta hydrolase [Methylobacterium oxalidis]GEP07818.1 oxidoreductase [Methylobacterium oxalidis]GJE34182.1 Putative aminoacrylate hydrolase RutD [Methylobacterium oxalidis]GLS67549.1 oxidoreductase [Methylobacterium oxalidis]
MSQSASVLRSVILGLALIIAGSVSSTERPWAVLPPTPKLPLATVSGRLPVNDIEMWRAELGSPDSKPVLLVHGGLANADYFGAIIPLLVDEGFRVIAVDSRGHGRSTRSAQPFSYELMAADILAMLDALQISRADLVGWSDGGIIGIVMAIRHPERLNRVFAFGANTVPDGVIADFDKAGVFAEFEKRASEEYRKLSLTPGEYDSFLKQIHDMWATQPDITTEQLKTIRTRMVVADGRYDEAIKQSHDRYMASTIPDARLVILPGVSHFAMLQNPPLFARAVLDALTASWDD